MSPPPDRLPSRRDWLSWVIAAAGSLLSVSGLAAVGSYLLPSRRQQSGVSRIEVAGEADMKPGDSKTVMGSTGPVIVVRTEQGHVALSATCTHLGCLVRYDPQRRSLLCPCHGGQFDLAGHRIAGPPPAPLKVLPLTVTDGKVYVSA